MGSRTAVPQPRTSREGSAPWTPLVGAAAAAGHAPRSPSVGQVVGRFVAANLVAVVLLLVGGLWASVEAAEDEARADAGRMTDVLAIVLVEPNLDAGLLTGDPAAVAALDAVLDGRLAGAGVMRVKIWTPQGRIVYSDEKRLIGMQWPLDEDDRRALRDGVTRSELSDLSRPENRYERSAGKLLEVYRQVTTPTGERLLLETYSVYNQATARQMEIWWEFAPISVVVLLALVVVQLPLARRMVTQLRASQREREQLQERALDASTEERRRIAGSLHDGIVQDVSAASLIVSRSADQLRTEEDHGNGHDRNRDRDRDEVAEVLDQAGVALRESVGSLRSLLVEIYPPDLARAGLPMALADLAARLRPRGIDVRVEVADDLDPPPAVAALLLRTAQEALRNVAKHARARSVTVTVREYPSGRLRLEVVDDGVGFDVNAVLQRPADGHLGLHLLADRAAAEGALLSLRTAPGAGTGLRLEVPRP